MDHPIPNIRPLLNLLEEMITREASDLSIAQESSAIFRIDGELSPAQNHLNSDELVEQLKNFAPPRHWIELQNNKHTTFATTLEGSQRLRACYKDTVKGLSASFRLLAAEPTPIEETGLEEALLNTLWAKHGLMIVTGSTGSGVTTLLASIVDAFNRIRNDRILCLEDPVEIVHEHKNSLVIQYDVRQHGGDFITALSRGGRYRPDIIVINDLLEPEIIEPILELAGSGTLVLAGMPFRSSVPALSYLVESLPTSRRKRVCSLLSRHLHWILAQTLTRPSRGRGLFTARELLLSDTVTRAVIEKGAFHELPEVMKSSARTGMVELNQALIRLVQTNDIKSSEAYRVSADHNRLTLEFRRSGIELAGLSALEKSILEHAAAPKPTRESIRAVGGPDQSGSHTRSGRIQRGWF
jgi:twitching motility protein PilT